MQKMTNYSSERRRSLLVEHGAGAVALACGLLACSAGAGDASSNGGDVPPGGGTQAPTPSLAPASSNGSRPSDEAVSAIGGEIDTVLLSLTLADERLSVAANDGRLGALSSQIAERSARLSALADRAQTALGELDTWGADGATREADAAKLEGLSRLAAQLPVQVRRIKQALRSAGVEQSTQPEIFRSLDTVKLAARSLGARVAELRALEGESPLTRLPADEAETIVRHSGELYPGSSWYVLDEGHVDIIDVAYEDDELGLSIHDESVDPDVERDPATTILVVKSSAKLQVPDERFAFLGPVGSNVWILPEGQPEAEAAGLLWPGVATAEVESGVFVGDAIDIRFRDVVGPNGLSLFESPDDELSNPNVLVDSENGLPDSLITPVGIHRHMNWAFESPGAYLVRVQARGQLAELPGTPWVSSANAVLKFVVLP